MPAHGWYIGYPAQLKPPLEPQPLLVEALVPPNELPSEAKDEIFFLVSWLWQEGQAGFMLASEKRITFSNSLPHSLHWYSYKGIAITFLSRYILYPSIAYLF
jgi:hypothetical protein